MSLNWMILCGKLINGLCKIVTKSQVITKFNVTKSRLHCTNIPRKMMIYTQKSDDLLLKKDQYCFVACIGIRLTMNIFLQNLHQKLAGWLKWKDKNFSSMTIGKAYYIDDQTKYILIQQGCVAQIGKTHRHTNK